MRLLVFDSKRLIHYLGRKIGLGGAPDREPVHVIPKSTPKTISGSHWSDMIIEINTVCQSRE